ncbi:MAG TPA: hypothetical protein VEH08_01120 [Methanomassiliicoccales archaeon]|nr:hypothetical protein [Methanomassiliicoccales archaeon]
MRALSRLAVLALAIQSGVAILAIALVWDDPILAYMVITMAVLVGWGAFATYTTRWHFAVAAALTGVLASAFSLATAPPFVILMAMLAACLGCGLLGERVATAKRVLARTKPGDERTEMLLHRAVGDIAISSFTFPTLLFVTSLVVTVLALNLGVGQLNVPLAVILSLVVVISAGYSVLSMRQAE